MGLFDMVLDAVADRVGKKIRGKEMKAAFSDARLKGTSFSVESMMCEGIADLMLSQFDAPVAGDNERSRKLDDESERFKNKKLRAAVVEGFITGDCLVVPIWNGRSFDNSIVPSGRFEVLQSMGDRLQAVAYLVDSKRIGGHEYALVQYVAAIDQGDGMYTNAYRLFAAKDGKLGDDLLLDEWREFDSSWSVPNVDRLLVGRFRSHTIDPNDPNAVKGVPICFGAGEPIKEIRYLLDQMHREFGLSEKAVFADKRLFKRRVDKDGTERLEIPQGSERMFKLVNGSRSVDADPMIHDWAPDIRYQAYLDALDRQEQLVEKAVGVSSGIISARNEASYQNLDNVRKSMAKTQAFVDTARDSAEEMLTDLVYSWDVLLNYYEAAPMGPYELMFEWSDEYIDSFSDRQNAILAGEAIGATDAADYRAFVMGETPDVARESVRRIKAERGTVSPLVALGD